MSDNRIAATLQGSPYSVSDEAASAMVADLADVDERVGLLRDQGRLSDDTLRRYCGAKRFEQVAESNAIEGGTLTVGETELAILKGVTITGKDPAHVRDAVSLDKALSRLVEMARQRRPVDIAEVKHFHELLFDARAGTGMFRSDPVRISGSRHRSPKTWHEVMGAMEDWEAWSKLKETAPPLLRASVLHAWLVHIHPFSDGNGRTGRAVTNLELIRAGFPPIIIRKRQDRMRYITALQVSDDAGDIGPFLDLVVERFKGALVGLESAAREGEGYSPAQARIVAAQRRKLAVWNKSLELFYEILVDRLSEMLEGVGGTVTSRSISNALELDDYLELCQGRAITKSWAFEIKVQVSGLSSVERLAWVGYRSGGLREAIGDRSEHAPTVYWSNRNPVGYPPWIQSGRDAPGAREMSITPGKGDEWMYLDQSRQFKTATTTGLAEIVAQGLVDLVR